MFLQGDKGNKYAVENRGLDEPHEDRRHEDRPDYRGRGHVNPTMYGDEDGDVKPSRNNMDDNMVDIPMGSAV